MIDYSSPAVRLRQRWRLVRDRLATLLIGACGIGVIVAVLAIGVFLVMAAWPLTTCAPVGLAFTCGIEKHPATNTTSAFCWGRHALYFRITIPPPGSASASRNFSKIFAKDQPIKN